MGPNSLQYHHLFPLAADAATVLKSQTTLISSLLSAHWFLPVILPRAVFLHQKNLSS